MPPTDQKTYTPGAERAARKIAYALVQPALANTVFNMDEFAATVSRETHDAEMLEALRVALEFLTGANTLNADGYICSRIEALIAKVEGR